MGTIWIEADEDRWTAGPLASFQLDGVRLVPYGSGAEHGTALLAPPGSRVIVNGQRIWGGLRILQHKDEIYVGGQRMFYSAEMQPGVIAHRTRADTPPPKCAVCRMPLRDGDSVVSCPGCCRLYHQSDAKPCWTYRDRCAFCSHPTSLAGDAGWRPEQEEAHG